MHRPAVPPASDRSFPSFWTLHLLGWTALGLSMWIGVLTHADDLGRAFVGKMIFAFLGGAFTLALRPLYRRLHERGTSVPRLIIVSAVCSYALTVVWSVLHKGGVHLLWDWVDGRALYLGSYGWLFNGTLFYTFIPMAWSVLYIGIKYYRDLQAERERALAAEGLAHQAHLQALRYQLNPHFLFNTLNAISTLVVEERNRDAERMVARLSTFLRLTLESDARAEVPLAEELEFARRYLDIEQIRFGDRLQVTIDADPETLSAQVPPLMLQPLVENAVRHGILPREGGGHLLVEARRVSDRLHLRVADDGPGPPSEDTLAHSSGVGIANVRSRLDALYDAAEMRLQRADGGGCVVTLALPFHTDPLSNAEAATRRDALPVSDSESPAAASHVRD
jgi:two-component sensor histidine kinase